MGTVFNTPTHHEGSYCPVLPCAVSLAAPQLKSELTCSVCTKVITDIDNWITSEKTEAEIVDFAKKVCHAAGQLVDGLEATCNLLVVAKLPSIIEGLVNDNLNPTEVCTNLIKACP